MGSERGSSRVSHRPLVDHAKHRARWAGTAALLALAGATTQASAAVLKCTYSNGAIAVYKISPDAWQQWDDKAWAWRDRPCEQPGVLAIFDDQIPACKIAISDEYYRWSQDADKGDDIKKTSTGPASPSTDKRVF